MDKNLSILVMLLFTTLAGAQNRTLLQELEREVPGRGNVRIERDVRIDSLIGYMSDAGSGTLIKAKGFRIQVYSGNNTRASKEKATSIANTLKASYPDLPVYTFFKSPRWLCTVGDFLSVEEAYETMRRLKKETTYKEIYILPNQEIRVPL
ncbi:MAG: SPOR domain-containing protein [Bacteroidaceae bacterium]|nr:SPOR domain-containing protein [Bacteroidaceae bacterium]